ncbi:MAG: IclR family transcriptional regulator [Deltaproteobacteria bacterium]|nr:IclR family transcriptional regulator [Deltaproteobacteria bacterium]
MIPVSFEMREAKPERPANKQGVNGMQYRTQALDRALDILDCFSFQNREMNLSALTQKTGLNKATAKRLTSNLTSRGYLQQDPGTKNYRLGMRLLELGGIVFSSLSLRQASTHHMNRLQEQTGATVLLGIRMEDQLVYVDKREGRGMIRIASDIGWRRHLHFGMLGMVLMAYLNPKEARRILRMNPLEAYTAFSLTDEDAFSLRLEQIRNQGHVLENQEAVEGVIGIAVPVRDYSRQVIAALGLAIPAGLGYDEDTLGRLVDFVKRTGDDISSDLGYMKL